MQAAIGNRIDEREMEVDVIEDEYGKESFEARIYYYGPWNYGGSPLELYDTWGKPEKVDEYKALLKNEINEYP
jgi:hypothetical protein